MKQCAYCGKQLVKNIKTKEHVIPHGLIELFPEQNITFTDERAYKDNQGQSISDVCKDCNGGYLSRLDQYGISLIKKYFMKKYRVDEKLKLEFDFNKLSRWLLKIAFNHERVAKHSTTWFRKNIKYIKGEEEKCSKISIYAGLHVDMNPMTEENGLYLPLSIGDNLKFYDAGILPFSAFGIEMKNERKPLEFKEIYKSYSFRFASAKFILILWKDEYSKENIKNIESIERLIETLFPYKNIEHKDMELERVDSGFLSQYSNLIVGNVGLSIMDQQLKATVPNLESIQEYFRKNVDWKKGELAKEIEELNIEKYNEENSKDSIMS